jgi:hypothetical protein
VELFDRCMAHCELPHIGMGEMREIVTYATFDIVEKILGICPESSNTVVYNKEETNSTQEQATMELIIFSPSDNLETLRKAVVGKISRKENGKNLTKASLIAKIEAHNATVSASNQPKPMLALSCFLTVSGCHSVI